MRRPRRRLEVSTFPFLAVLLCAMGSLILLLLVMDRRAKAAARLRAEVAAQAVLAERAAMARAAADEAARRKAEWAAERERHRAALHDELARAKDQVAGERRSVEARRSQATRNAAAQSQRWRELLEVLGSQREELAKAEKETAAARETTAEVRQTGEAASKEAVRLSAQLRGLEVVLGELKAARRREAQTYSLMPYRGKRGDGRRPLYLECTSGGLVFHPDRKTLTRITTAEDIRSEVEARVERQRQAVLAKGGQPDERAYLLMLVRPDGLSAYYGTLAALRGKEIDFGYEFIDADWVLDFPEGDGAPAQQPWMNPQRVAAAPADPSAPKRKVTGLRPGKIAGEGEELTEGDGGGAGAGPRTGVARGSSSGLPPLPGTPGVGAGSGSSDLPPLPGTPGGGSMSGGAGPAVARGPGVTWGPTGSGTGGPAGGPGLPPLPGMTPGGAGGGASGQMSDPRSLTGGAGPGSSLTPGAAPGGSGVSAPVPGGWRPGSGLPPLSAGGGGAGGGTGTPNPDGNQSGQPRAVPGGGAGTGQSGGGAGTGQSGGGTGTGQPSGTPGATGGGGGNSGPPSPFPLDREAQAPTASGGQSGGTAGGGQPSAGGASGQPGAGQPGGAGSGGEPAGAGGVPPAGPGPAGPRQVGQPHDPDEPQGPNLGGGLIPGPDRPPPAPAQRPFRLIGNRDWVIPIECHVDGVVLRGAGQKFPLKSLTASGPAETPLLQSLRQIIARRQATVRPGEPPYRPQVRLLIYPDGLRTYYLTFPTLEPLGIPLTRQNVEADPSPRPAP